MNKEASRFDRVVDVDAAHGVHLESMEGKRHFLTEQLPLGWVPWKGPGLDFLFLKLDFGVLEKNGS